MDVCSRERTTDCIYEDDCWWSIVEKFGMVGKRGSSIV